MKSSISRVKKPESNHKYVNSYTRYCTAVRLERRGSRENLGISKKELGNENQKKKKKKKKREKERKKN